MANRDVAELVFVDYSSKTPFLNLDYANVTTYDVTGEVVYAYGGHGHPRRVSFSGERGGTLTIETQIQPFKLYSLVTGAEIENTAKFLKREVLTAGASGALTLSATAVGNVSVFKADDDCGTALEATGSGTAYTASGLSQGDKAVVYYITSVSSGVKKLSIKSTTFPKAFTVYGETTYKTEDDELLAMKLIAYKCAPQSNLSLAYSNTGDPATLTITCDLMEDDEHNVLDLIQIEE